MTELKPCPFCGQPGQEAMYDSQYWIACGNQECWIHDFKTSAEEAAAAWNSRPVEDALVRRINDLENALRATATEKR